MLAAYAAKTRNRDIGFVLALFSQFLFDERLDRQTVAIVTGHVRSIKAHHRTRFYDEILEDLIQRGPDMNVGIGVGRPVVKYELLAPLSGLGDRAVQVNFRPSL